MGISGQTKRRWAKRVEYLIENQDGLTDWEIGFVESMERRLGAGLDLTFGQSIKLGEVFKKIDEGVGG